MLNHIRFEVGVNLFCSLLLMADVIAMYIVVDVTPLRLMLLPIVFIVPWLMLLPMYLWQML